uniref:Uncharacterized protein n=1 Tax=Peronospora matthiolae TaxID=2874970 RepID=A0AAV1UXU9_9STRA
MPILRPRSTPLCRRSRGGGFAACILRSQSPAVCSDDAVADVYAAGATVAATAVVLLF